MPRILTALIVAVAAAAWTSVADAANWVTSGPLSPPGKLAISPRLTVTPSGERVIAWVQQGTTGLSPENVSIRIAPPGGDFGPTQTLPATPQDLSMATAADGTVAIAWTEFASRTVHIARRAPGQTAFVEAAPFVPPGNEVPLGAALAFSGGDVVAATPTALLSGGRARSLWALRLTSDDTAVKAVPGTAAGGSLEHSENVNGQPQIFFVDPKVVAGSGELAVAWSTERVEADQKHSLTTVRYVRGVARTDAFSAPTDVDSQTDASSFPPTMETALASGGGRTDLAWTRERTGAVFFQDLARPGTTQTIPGPGSGVGGLHAGMDGSGALVVAFVAIPPGLDNNSVFSGVVPAGTTPGPAVAVTPAGIRREVGALAVAADGSSLVLPVRSRTAFEDTLEVEGGFRSPGAAFGPPETVSGVQDDSPANFFGTTPSAAVLPGGRALALWSASDHEGAVNLRLFLSERDVTSPAFTAIDAPDGAVAGRRAAFAATATDDLSDPAVSWDFGDGTQATGASVTHVFGAAGASTVTITARDTAGNVTTQTRVVAVAPAPVTPPPTGGGGAPAPRDTTAPVVSNLTATNRTFVAGRSATAVLAAKKPKKTPKGTVLRLRVSERATLAVALSLKKGKRRTPAGTLVRASAGPGAASVAFTGRVGKTALAPGSYVATVTAIDGAGNRSKPKTLNLTIVRK